MVPRWRKPRELLELGPATDELFRVLREEFHVPAVYELRLEHVGEQKPKLPLDMAAYTLWQVRLLHHLATPGVITTSEAVITTCSQLAYHLNLLASGVAPSDGQDVILRVRQELFVAAKTIIALDGAVDGPPIELF